MSERDFKKRGEAMIRGEDPGPHPDCSCQKTGWTVAEGHMIWECVLQRPPKPDPRDARIAEMEKRLAEWKQAIAITQEAIEIQRRIGDTKAAILTAERDALRALLVEVEAYVLNCRNAYPAPSRLETDDLLRRVREAGR